MYRFVHLHSHSHMLLTFVVLLLTSLAASQNATKCFECSDLPHLVYCNKVTTCPQGQICVVEKRITSTNWDLYNSGCQSRERCSARGSRGVPKRSFRSRRSDHVVCEECCDGDFCNYQGCGDAAPMQPKRGPMCFQCPQLENPGDCTTLGTCRVGEICMLTELNTTSATGGRLYKSQCVTQTACYPTSLALVGRKKRASLCHTCCHDDFCNGHCEAIIEPTTTTRTTPAVTTMTTTTATTTTTSTPTTTMSLSRKDKCSQHHYHYTIYQHEPVCYKFHYELRPWGEANAICESEGGHLATVDDMTQWGALTWRMKRDHRLSGPVYIGAIQHPDSDGFQWVNGDRLTFANWDSEHTDKANQDQCIVTASEYNWGWHSTTCTHPYQFACTLDL